MAYPANMYGSGGDVQISPDVQRWFSTVDRDNSGEISAKELRSALANGQGGHFSEKACSLMIGMFDKDKKGTINLQEFQALFNYVNSWLSVFRMYDQDNSGSIQEHELAAALTQMGYSLSPEFYSAVVKKCDPTEKKSITVDNFIVVCVQIQKCTEAFKVRDVNQTGVITIGFEDFVNTMINCTI